MGNRSLAEIQLIGEEQVASWLSGNGYSNVEKEILPSRETHIKANGLVENILVGVKTFLHPHRPFKLSDFEADVLQRKASKLKLIAYAAYVVLNDKDEVVDEITWERLS